MHTITPYTLAHVKQGVRIPYPVSFPTGEMKMFIHGYSQGEDEDIILSKKILLLLLVNKSGKMMFHTTATGVPRIQ